LLSSTSCFVVPRIERTGPVKTFADFVDHVPTSCAFRAEVEEMKHAPAKSSDCVKDDDIVVVNRTSVVIQDGKGTN